MTASVEVVVSARLHLGFLDLTASPYRRFGSLGLALDQPCTRLRLERAEGDRIDGPEQERAARHLATLVGAFGIGDRHVLAIEEAIPAHAGLGSGTQLALAVAAAVRRLHGLPPSLRLDAKLLGRGLRSGVGVALFAQGGLVLDGGRGRAPDPPPLVVRLPLPESWRVLLLLDPAHVGLSGGEERTAFAALPPMSEAVSGELCRLAVMRLLPAAAEADLPSFGVALTRLQEIVGDHFGPAQGGRQTSPRVGAALARLGAMGATGLGQSSWGPTGFAFCANPTEAQRFQDALARAPEGAGLDIRVCRGLNRGASVTAA